ncbi:MAG: TIM barrel protein [Roseiflexaceae bacterium]|nr:TIM barrel protein [Roseiflexaceae bacterium]
MMFQNLSAGAVGIKLPLPELLKLAAKVGWGGVELPVAEALQLERARGEGTVANLYAAAGLKAGGWGLPLDWRVPYDEAAIQEFDQQTALAASLGSTRCFTWLLPFSDERPFRENFEFHIHQLRPVARVLEEYGCQLGLEFIGPRTLRESHRYGFIYTIEGMLSLAAAIGPNVGLLVDAWHVYTGLGVLADLRTLRAADVVYVHINDAPTGIAIEAQNDHVRALPGATGVIDLNGFLTTLRDIGYDGPVTPEPFDQALAARPPDEICQITHEHLDRVFTAAGVA